MAKEVRFSVSFEGRSIDEGSIDVKDLAPALLSLNEVLSESNKIMGNPFDISLNVKSVQKEYFEIELFVTASNGFEKSAQIFYDDEISSIKNLLHILGIGESDLFGLIKLILKAKGKKPYEIKIIQDDNVTQFIYDNETIETPKGTEKLYANRNVRQNLIKFFNPLLNKGISKIIFKRDSDIIQISDQNIDYYNIAEDTKDILIDVTNEKVFKIVSLSFKEDNKWRLNDGANTFNVVIKDDAFLKNIGNNKVSFVKGSMLKVMLRTLQKRKGNKLITVYEVVDVLKHIKPQEQPTLF